MSDPVEKAFASSALKPASNPGEGRRQQWRLIFEKAYLALSRNDIARVRQDAKSVSVAEASPHENHPVIQAAHPAQPDASAAAGPAPLTAVYEYGGDTVDFAMSDNGGLERRLAELLGGLSFPSGPDRQQAAVKSSAPAWETPQAREYKGVLRDKSLLLLPADDGLQLVIRDAAIDGNLLRRIVQKVQDVLNSRGFQLARVVVNGAELWRITAEDDTDAGSAEFSADLVNRIY